MCAGVLKLKVKLVGNLVVNYCINYNNDPVMYIYIYMKNNVGASDDNKTEILTTIITGRTP